MTGKFSSQTIFIFATMAMNAAFLAGQDQAGQAQPPSAPDPVAAFQTRIMQVYQEAAPSVVAIARVRRDRLNALDALPFNRPGMGLPLIDPTRPEFVPTEFGTGIVISHQGDVLTCFHVLDDPAKNDYWIWHQGLVHRAAATAYPAKLQAGDPWTDLAVLRMGDVDVRPIALGDSRKLQIGQFALVLGNPYAIARDGRASMAWGMVSNLQRKAPEIAASETERSTGKQSVHEYGTLIQIDAKINLGTSGGAVLDLEGKLVGMTTALAALEGFEQSAGYAIPIDGPMKAAIDSLSKGERPTFGFLGVEPVDATTHLAPRGLSGALLRRVVPGFPGDLAGLRPGDVVTAIDGHPIEGAAALFREVSRRPAHRPTQLSVIRAEQLTAQPVPLAALLGKKHVETLKPAFAITPEPSWRGMKVDWSTALPPDRLFGAEFAAEIPPPVAVTAVDPDSPAWRAGLRLAMFLLSVDGETIESPAQFFRLIDSKQGSQSLRILGDGGRPQAVTVSEP